MTNEPHDENLKRKVLIGAAWTIGARWGVRFLGLISTVILARLLAPEDFGLVAMASIFTGIIMAFTQMEMDIGIIRLKKVEDDHFNTAWTISVIIGFSAGIVLLLLAPVAADYYHEPRVKEILSWVALSPMILSLDNPKTVLFRKNFNFSKDFQYSILTKLSAISVSIPLAFILRDYRALVFGMLASSVARVIIGYILLPYLPKPSMAKKQDLFSFSAWIVVRNVGFAAMGRIEQLVLGANFGPQRTSYYYIGSEIGGMISSEIALPMGRALLPAMSAAQNDDERMKRGVLMTLAGVSIALPFGFGLASLTPEFISVVLGDKWLPAAGVMEILSISAAISALSAPFGPLIMVMGKVKWLALASIAGSIFMLVTAQALSIYNSLLLIAAGRVVLQFSLFFFLMYLAISQWPGLMKKCIILILRPLFASFVMYVAIKSGQQYFGLPPVYALIFWPVVGALIFVSLLMSVWMIAGRPAGLEQYVSGAWNKFYRKVRS